MKSFISFLVAFVLFLDQATKYVISANFNPGKSVAIIKGFFHLTLVHNSGTAFGLFKNGTYFFIIISLIAAVFIVIFLHTKKEKKILADCALALILAGALGNLIDRLRFGYVIDFLDFRVWPVFNIADSAITIGIFLLIICIQYYSK